MITLYTAQTPNGRKASIALEELGLVYEAEWIKLDGAQHAPSFLTLNPNHKSPVLKDDELVVWESGDIMHYPWLRIGLDLGMPALVEKPRVAEWIERIGDRPAVKKGMEVPA